jgi:hypothetical protein
MQREKHGDDPCRESLPRAERQKSKRPPRLGGLTSSLRRNASITVPPERRHASFELLFATLAHSASKRRLVVRAA